MDSHGLSVRMHLDNSTVVCYINKGGGTKSIELTRTAKALRSFLHRHLLTMATNLAWALNFEGNNESRAVSDSSD